MKIYHGTHKAYFQKQVSLGNLPLSFIHNDTQDNIMTIKIRDGFDAPYEETSVHPHQTFTSNDILFFNNRNEPVQSSLTYFQINSDGEYEVLPHYIQEFYPKEFTYDILLRRTGQYSKKKEYRINLDFANTRGEEIRNALLSIVQNVESHKQYPSNIIFNGGEVKIGAEAPEHSDFVFFKYAYIAGEDVQEALAQHKNVWVCFNSFNDCIRTDGTKEEGGYTLSNGQVFSTVSGSLDPIEKNGTAYALVDPTKNWIDWTAKRSYQAEIKTLLQNLENDPEGTTEDIEQQIQSFQNIINSLDEQAKDYERVSDFFLSGSPLAIFHKKDSGYIIISHSSFLENLNSGTDKGAALRLFLETILYVYLNSYCWIGKRTSFIADETIDYYINTAKPYYLPHPKISLKRLLQSASFSTAIQYQVVSVNTAPKETKYQNIFSVEYMGINRNGNLLFKKKALSKMKDPPKGNNMLIYTINRTLAIYNPEQIDLWTIESGVSVRQLDAYTLSVSPVISSRYRIFKPEETILSVEGIGTWHICYQPGLNDIVIVRPKDKQDTWIILADVEIVINEEIDYKDIRIPGGGEASAEPDYEMIDTGNLYGRPYRYGCPMIIRIPKRYRPMQKEIRNEIEKHMTSGDYPIILYKD